VDGSLRRGGQLLVLVGALLGALVGVTLGLVVDDPGAGTAGVAQAPDRGAVVAAGATGSQPPTSGTVGTGSDGPADRPGKARAKDRDKSDKARSKGRGKDKPGKDKRDDKKSERD
jgi:hypothetical protein